MVGDRPQPPLDRHVAPGPDGTVAWWAGKQAFAQPARASRKFDRGAVDRRRTGIRAEGLAARLAHYNGVSMWFPNAQAAPEMLEWKGSHLQVAVSPNGQFLVTAMQEPALHGWRVVDAKHMRMSGYSGAVRSLAGPRAASGWPPRAPSSSSSGCSRQGGPMGKQPKMFAASGARHRGRLPSQAGGRRGRLRGRQVLLVRIEDGAEVLAQEAGRGPGHRARLGCTGSLLGGGTEAGEAGVIDLG